MRTDCPIGVMASDEDAYKTFYDLFEPIINELHPRFEPKFAYKLEELNLPRIEQQLRQMEDDLF